MANNNIKCNLCGNEDFYEETGFYYCKECQTQSQDIREHVFEGVDNEDYAVKSGRSKKVKKKKTDPTENLLTSWEGYNYILVGLVDELIELGADPKLKSVVQILWFKYLNKLEVIHLGDNRPPKLSALYHPKDALLVYGRKKHKKQTKRSRASSPSSDLTSLDASSIKSERRKKRRELIESEYQSMSVNCTQEESLHNVSLSSVKSNETTSKKEEEYLQYTTNAKKVLLKNMTKSHLKTHVRDASSELSCHKITYKATTTKYQQSPHVLTRMKVYCLIYLGLLIVKDKIQLGDLLRFIKEGALSFHYVKHFFPEEHQEDDANYDFWDRAHLIPTTLAFRSVAGELAVFLNVTKYIKLPDLNGLCARYCKEMNLPDELFSLIQTLISRITTPKMRFNMKSKTIPNFEGRAICLVIFTVKLVFGLDGATEYFLSDFAHDINQNAIKGTTKMFEYKKWERLIKYRRAVQKIFHFPSQYSSGNVTDNADNYLNFVSSYREKYGQDKSYHAAEVVQQILKKLAAAQNEHEFTTTFTSYGNFITNTTLNSYIPDNKTNILTILGVNHTEDSIKFATVPYVYLEQLYEKYKIKHRGRKNEYKFVEMRSTSAKKEEERKNAATEILVSIKSSSDCTKNTKTDDLPSKQISAEERLESFKLDHEKTYKENKAKMISYCQQFDETVIKNHKKRERFSYYNSCERYWLNIQHTVKTSKEDFKIILETFPHSFKVVLDEGSRLTEQTSKELFEEFVIVELHMCYKESFKSKKVASGIADAHLRKFVTKTESLW